VWSLTGEDGCCAGGSACAPALPSPRRRPIPGCWRSGVGGSISTTFERVFELASPYAPGL